MTQRSPHYPLFQTKTLLKRMSSFGFPADLNERANKISKWTRYLQEGHQTNEATDAEFINDIFADVLGYHSPFNIGSKIWELEFHPQPGLGFFTTTTNNVIAEIYIQPIERTVSPQYESTEWLIAADYRNIRLYHKAKSVLFYQNFSLELLTTDFEYLKQFYFILCRRTLLPGTPQSTEPSRTTQLLKESEQIEAAIAKDIYSQYHKICLQLVKDFQYRLQQLPNLEEAIAQTYVGVELQSETTALINQVAILQAQKLLHRILFIAFCEDKGLLPDAMLSDAYEFYNPYINQLVWENYKAIFSWIFQGSSKLKQPIPRYGSDLFKPDVLLDKYLYVGDELCRQIKEITRFNFQEEIPFTIIIHLLEEFFRDLASLQEDPQDSSGKRRKFKYPPKSLSSSVSVRQILQNYLDRKLAGLPPAEEATPEEILDFYQAQKQYLLELVIVDSQCGVGTFLATALEFLVATHAEIDRAMELQITRVGDRSTSASKKLSMPLVSSTSILERNLYGCDNRPEAVEITKLNLWLRTVQSNQPLACLEENIKLGDMSKSGFSERFQQAEAEDKLIILS